jgi:hypothetical protein
MYEIGKCQPLQRSFQNAAQIFLFTERHQDAGLDAGNMVSVKVDGELTY